MHLWFPKPTHYLIHICMRANLPKTAPFKHFSLSWGPSKILQPLSDRYVKSYANKDSCAAMLHCCFAASEMAFSESSQPPLLHCIATSLQSHIKWQSELKQYNSRCFVALLQYYIRCQSELKADPATSLLCYNLCQPEPVSYTHLTLPTIYSV